MAKRKVTGLVLRNSSPDEGFSTLDLVNGTQGVCQALDAIAIDSTDVDLIQRLSMAAKILSRMVADRVEQQL